MKSQSIEDLITAAHQIVHELLRTEVTAFDVVTALEKHCAGWDDPEKDAALRLAHEFAEIKGNTLLLSMHERHAENMAEMEHHLFVGYELGNYLDLPVVFEWDEETRERSFWHRSTLYPLRLD